MINQLSHVSKDIQTIDNTELITHLQVELHAVDTSEIDLEIFESKKDINELNIPALTEQVQKAAPELWKLLAGLMKPQCFSHCDILTRYKGSMVMICSILAHAHAFINCNNLLMLLELHLHSMRVKQQTINVLAGLGVTSIY